MSSEPLPVRELIDPRVRPRLDDEWARLRDGWGEPLPGATPIVLVGHRAAGKTTLAPALAERLGLPWLDLDAELERRAGRPLRGWLTGNPQGFRRAERELFVELRGPAVMAVGGGFLSLHADLLAGALAVLVPVSFESYRERLTADTTRPRLMPELSPEEELRRVWAEREEAHARVATVSLPRLLARARSGFRARRVATVPPGLEPVLFAQQARAAGAELLEVRTDLTPLRTRMSEVAAVMPVLVSQRGKELPEAWVEWAQWVDVPDDASAPDQPPQKLLRSFHSDRPFTLDEALAHWPELPPGTHLKHVEPLGSPREGGRLLELQRRLAERFGPGRVTVLATGPLALPFRAVLARGNALDYCALDGSWSAAPGQRLVADAAREWRRRPAPARLGILGHSIEHSRSPRIHRPPFDRIDLPADAPVRELVDALLPWYAGFAVTSPFKQRWPERGTLNTLIRAGDAWRSANCDVEGARAVLQALGAPAVFVLGDGGSTQALREAAAALGVTLEVVKRAQARPLGGAGVWTWPDGVEPPAALSLQGARVAVIAYGPPGRRVAAHVRRLGGTPLMLGPRWLIAQARRQAELWQEGGDR